MYDAHMEFARHALLLLRAEGGIARAYDLACEEGNPKACQFFKAAIDIGTTADPDFAASLATYNGVVSAFVASLRNASVFDALLPLAVRVPLRTSVAVTTTAMVGSAVDEGAPKPVTQGGFDIDPIEPRKAIGQIVVTKELERFSGTMGVDLLNRELRGAVVSSTNAIFLTGVLPSPISSLGTPLADLRALLAAVRTGSASRLLFVVSSHLAKKLATTATADGALLFADFSPVAGGSLLNVPAIVSDELEEDSSATGSIALFDASGLALGDLTVVLSTSRHGAVQMESEPTNPLTGNTVLESLWQRNLMALKAERYFGFDKLRDDAVAVISGADYDADEA